MKTSIIKHYTDLLNDKNITSDFFELYKKNKSELDLLDLSNRNIILAVSWWADSMLMSALMIYYFHKNSYSLKRIHIAHCNHKIRQESEDEAKAMKEFFSWLDFNLYERNKSDTSQDENTLRIRRYSQFSSLQKITNSSFIFVGHHLNDRVESSFLNLIRWANLKGFLNMHFHQTHPLLPEWCEVCRPLISSSKENILNICNSLWLAYFEDITNNDISVSKRNRIRNEIINKISKFWDNKTNNFLNSFQQIYKELEKIKKSEKCENWLINIPSFPTWNVEFSYKREWNILTCNNNEFVSLIQSLWIKNQISSILINERREWLNKWNNSYKYFWWTYFFIHEKELYIIKAEKNFWIKKTNNIEVRIENMKSIDFFWFKLDIPREELIWWIIRLPNTWDSFNWKSWNRRALNQKIPMRWRNWIPVCIKNWKMIHMWKKITNIKK